MESFISGVVNDGDVSHAIPHVGTASQFLSVLEFAQSHCGIYESVFVAGHITSPEPVGVDHEPSPRRNVVEEGVQVALIFAGVTTELSIVHTVPLHDTVMSPLSQSETHHDVTSTVIAFHTLVAVTHAPVKSIVSTVQDEPRLLHSSLNCIDTFQPIHATTESIFSLTVNDELYAIESQVKAQDVDGSRISVSFVMRAKPLSVIAVISYICFKCNL